MAATADTDSIPDGWKDTMNDNDWSDAEREAWHVIHDARPGDFVLWADRKMAMEVAEREQDEEGHHVLHVEKPRGEGTYEVHERYSNGKPKFTSPIGRANNLHFVERVEEPRGLTESEYADLVERQAENATDAFMRLDYGGWGDAVADVTEQWADDVAFMQWTGYKHHPDWTEDDPGAIFESVIEHSTFAGYDEDHSLKSQAEAALYNDVFQAGRETAEASIISSASDYRDVVEKLAHHSLDRYDRKNYDSARVAVRDTISNWIDERESPVYQSIIEHGTDRFADSDYAELSSEEVARERAYDILDHDVWEVAQEYQRARGEHDPTLRGLTYTAYKDLVDTLVGEALRRYEGRGFLRPIVQEVIDEWADSVEAHEWDGHRHRVYVEGDAEDIFASAAVHADADPFVWNPFAADKERRMAVSAMRGDVLNATRYALDNDDPRTVEAISADDYIQQHLVEDGSYEDIIAAEDGEIETFLEEVYTAIDGDEVGWTFVDEILEMDGVVPQMSNDWLLVDYGVIRQGERLRKLAWFNRENGAVLILSGLASATPEQLVEGNVEDPYQTFSVVRIEHGENSPNYLLTDADLGTALGYIYDYLDADRADFRLIETEDDVLVRDIVQDEDLNAGGVLDALVPNINLPGVDDISAFGSDATVGAGRWVRFWLPELKGLATWGAMWYIPHNIGKHLDGIRVEPNVHKRHGVGLNVSYEYGSAPHEQGVGGKADVDLNIRPSTFSRLSDRYAPKFARRGFDEGDLGKGVISTAGEGVQRAAADPWGAAFLDEFGGSVQTFFDVLRRGQRKSVDERMRREFLTDLHGEEPDDLDAAWDDLAPEVRQNYGNYVAEEVNDLTWQDIHDEDIGVSGMLMRGLNAEAIVGTKMERDDGLLGVLNVKKLLRETTFYGSDYATSDPPTFEEWEEARYGPGQPGGPEDEARRMARFHKEVAAGTDAPDPYTALDIDEATLGEIREQPDELGDYEMVQYDDEYGTSFDDVAAQINETDETAL